MDIHISSTPRHLRITPTMIDDFLIDPVLGAKVIMGFDLDAFQAIRLRTFWWVPEVIDSSGFSTGKTSSGAWLFLNLRACLIGDQVEGMYFQTFETGKQTFWTYYNRKHHPIFAAQLGHQNVEGKDAGKENTRGASCYNQFFKNGSEIKMPAPNWEQQAVGQASLRYNVIAIDEWPKAEVMGEGINRQILGRLTRESRHKDHPLWCNHQVFLGVAESMTHPAYARVRSVDKRIAAGDPTVAHISFCFKDYSNLPMRDGKSFSDILRVDRTINRMKSEFTPSHYRREVLGLWSREGKGWYDEESVERCIAHGRERGLTPFTGRTGNDPRIMTGNPALN